MPDKEQDIVLNKVASSVEQFGSALLFFTPVLCDT